MKNNVNQEWISKLLVIAFVAVIFVLAFTWIIFDFQNSSSSLKDSWTIVSSLFSGIATLVAAYIAAHLFNDWRDQAKDKRNEYFILKYFDYLDYMNQLLVNLAFSYRDFEDRELFNAKVAYFIDSLTTQHMQAGSRLKAIAQDDKLDVLIEREYSDRETLMKKYINDIRSASKKTKTNPNAIKDTLDLYSGQNSLVSVYRNITSKDVSEYCLKKLTSFD